MRMLGITHRKRLHCELVAQTVGAVVGACLLIMLGVGCGSSQLQYPDVQLRTAGLSEDLVDPRRERVTELSQRPPLYRDETETFPLDFPKAEYKAVTAERLARLALGEGPAIQVHTEVRRADVTFLNDYRGDFVRWDVELGFQLTTHSGAALHRGKGVAWLEIPKEEATDEEMRRLLLSTAVDAFDRFFADARTLETINSNLREYNERRPVQDAR
jgi:hypothetical protein